MNREQINKLYETTIKTAATIIGNGNEQPAMMVVFNGDKGRPIDASELFAIYGKPEAFRIMSHFAKDVLKADLVMYITEAWASIVGKNDDLANYPPSGKVVKDMPDAHELLLIQMETRTSRWCWNHPILKDDAGSRFIDTSEKVEPFRDESTQGVSFLYETVAAN